MSAIRPIAKRLYEKTERRGECIIWTGAVANSGYGRIGVPGAGATDQVHRVAYRLAHGAIPDGLHIDHLCNNRLCVNPDHLEAVTQAENNRRAWKRRLKNTCLHGHPTELYRRTMPSGRTYCTACHKEYRDRDHITDRSNRTERDHP